jgi:hypothetical protein
MRTKFLRSILCLGLLGTTLVPMALGQNPPSADELSDMKARVEQLQSAYAQLPPNHRALLDGGKHLLQLALVREKLAVSAAAGKPLSRKDFSKAMGAADGGKNTGVVSVNDPSTDLDFSGFDGVTQSETHTAQCGNQVVVGFNDSGSPFQGSSSFSGGAVSSDGGMTFRDIGPIQAGTPKFVSGHNALAGDPILTCSGPSTFYFTQLFEFDDGVSRRGHFKTVFTAIAISKSSDGGNTWGDPLAVITKTNCVELGTGTSVICPTQHFLDKPWSAIDPSNAQKMYITYTDFDSTGTSPGCGAQTRTAIELVSSIDGGQHWSAPTIIDEQCGDNVAVQASHVAVNSHGVAYIAWQRFGTPTGDEVRITHLAPNGTPAPSVLIDRKVFGGDTFLVVRGFVTSFGTLTGQGFEFETDLQGQFRDLVGLDLAVDHSGGPNDGTVYVTWDDARNKSVPDLVGFTPRGTGVTPFDGVLVNGFTPLIQTAGNYAYTDVRVSKSKDGVHFGPSVQVNSDRQPKFGGGHDHFQPAIATDSTGRVAVCWYDRRNDPQNFQIERFCAESKNRGDGDDNEWRNFRVPISAFAPIHRQDFTVVPGYMGDYDGLTSDFTGKTKGFIGAFEWMSSGMNPDVKAYRFE